MRKAGLFLALAEAFAVGAQAAAPAVDWNGSSRDGGARLIEKISVHSVELPSIEAFPRAARDEIRIEGGGLVKGGGVLLKGFFDEPQGTLTVAGRVSVQGMGVYGEGDVSGAIPVRGDWPINPDRLKGCGQVIGSVSLKDAKGLPAGQASVSGPVCVEGQAYWVRVPFVGGHWVGNVQGNAKVSGVLP